MKASLSFEERIVECYREHYGEKLVSLVLFGSRARAEAGEASDYDILLVVEDLPAGHFNRLMEVRKPLGGKFSERVSAVARTPAEFDSRFPSLYLDLGMDGKVLYDRQDYMTRRLGRIRSVIGKAGLRRTRQGRQFSWEWKQPVRPGWTLDWGGLHEV